jgi:hypothetical protein
VAGAAASSTAGSSDISLIATCIIPMRLGQQLLLLQILLLLLLLLLDMRLILLLLLLLLDLQLVWLHEGYWDLNAVASAPATVEAAVLGCKITVIAVTCQA